MKLSTLSRYFLSVMATILGLQMFGAAAAVAQFQAVSRFGGGSGRSNETSATASRGSISDETKSVQMSLSDDVTSLPVAVESVPSYSFQPLPQYQSSRTSLTVTQQVAKLQFSDLQQYVNNAPSAPQSVGFPNASASANYGSYTVQPVNIATFRAQSTPSISGRFSGLSAAPGEGTLKKVDRLSSTVTGFMEDQSRFSTHVTAKTWTSPDLFWQPLYFEEAAAERYGHHCGVFQPAVSGGQFLKNVVFLPYKVASHPPFESEHGLGHDRPGNRVEPYRELPEINARGFVGQGLVIGGLVFGL